ncbi:STAS domain-containing protein [Aquincola sp. MAHUQ-54]|uniref:STAS domain-containing protein n=1 Tax=Aquincola agrisoli TaxID=3119538 RepID=A0AAW9QM13_9BURK
MLALPPRLTFADACSVLGSLGAASAEAPTAPLVIDGSALKTFDSSAIAVLLECRRAALAAGRPFSVVNLPASLAELAGLYGVAELLGVEAAQAPGVA